MEEKWLDVKGYSNYEVSNRGRVRRKKTGRVLKHSLYANKFYRVSLIKETNSRDIKQFRVHRLVAEHFIGELNDDIRVLHIDGDSSNNNVENLQLYDSSKKRVKEVVVPTSKVIKLEDKRVLTQKEWQDKTDEENETEPNYKALMYCILHNVTADDALRQMGVYYRQRSSSEKAIIDDSYVSEKRRGRQTPDKDRTING